ncbi:CAP domain-containing protein [Exiguobacterium indicum]|uniref:CAP domain-containing protein n=1 Tax=Exiguobacterium indicum TaxID=296995 RepID=A0ABU8EM19_9BACL
MKHRYAPLALSVLLMSGVFIPLPAQPVKVEAAEHQYEKYQLDLLAQVNFERKMVGLNPVKLHPLLCKSAVNHETYLRLNGYAYGHEEVKGDKGFTGKRNYDRIKAVGYPSGFSSYETITSTGDDYTALMRDMIQTAPYHRDAMFSPLAEYIGFGYSKGGVVVTNAIINDDYDSDVFLNYPYNGQTDVDIAYYGDEDPDPLKGTGLERSGIISSFYPSNYYYLGSEKATMVDSKGTKIPLVLETGGIGTLLIIPKILLDYNTTYTVSASVVDEDTGRKASRTWSFTTKEDPKLDGKGRKFVDYKPKQYWSKGMVWAVDKKFLSPYAKKDAKTKKPTLYLKPSSRLTEGELLTAFTKYYYAAEYKKTKPVAPSWKYSVAYQLAKKHDLPTMATLMSRKKATSYVERGDMLRILASAHLRKPVSEQVAFDTLKELDVVKDRSLTAFDPKADTSRAHLATYLYRYISSR